MKRIFFWTPLIGVFFACSEAGPGRQQYAECYVRYLAPEAQLRAEIALFETNPASGAPQPVNPPDGVRYRDILMGSANAPRNTYRLERSGGYSPEHSFRWKDPENRLCTFAGNLPAIPAFSFGTPALSRQSPVRLQWDGEPLENGESLVFMWEKTGESRTVPMEIVAPAGQNHIDFPAAQLSKLTPGQWTLYLVRKKRVQTKINDTPVKAVFEYYSGVDTLEIN